MVGDLAGQGGHFTSTTPPVAGTGNSRNGTRAKTVLTDVGPVEVTVPRDRDGSFEPKIVAKRQKRLTGGELDGDLHGGVSLRPDPVEPGGRDRC